MANLPPTVSVHHGAGNVVPRGATFVLERDGHLVPLGLVQRLEKPRGRRHHFSRHVLVGRTRAVGTARITSSVSEPRTASGYSANVARKDSTRGSTQAMRLSYNYFGFSMPGFGSGLIIIPPAGPADSNLISSVRTYPLAGLAIWTVMGFTFGVVIG